MLDSLSAALLHSLWQFTAVALLLKLVLGSFTTSHARYRASCIVLATVPITFIVTLNAHAPTSLITRVVLPLTSFTFSYREAGNAALLSGLGLELLAPYIITAWFLGIGLNALRLLGGWLYLTRLRRAVSDLSPSWQEHIARLRKTLSVSSSVQVCASPLVTVPTVVGLFKPLILVPASVLSGLSRAQLEAILVHELFHVKRYDALVNAAQTIIESLFFYHPAVHWLSAIIRQEREHCCDDAVVAFTGDARAYARALVELETLRPSQTRLGLAATGGSLMKRIRRLVRPPQPARHTPVRLPILSVLIAGLLAACGSGTFRTNVTATALTEVEAFCFQSVSVRTGSHEMSAFNNASVRAMKTALARRGYGVGCNGSAADLSLEYDMAFDAQSLTWQAVMRVSDAQGELLYLASAKDAIDGNGAFQYTTESTAERLLGRILDR